MRSADTEAGLLRIGELAEASGVPVPTIKHYLREGLLPEPVKTSRNMAYYPPEFVDRIRLIKRLQEERFMPLKAIRGLLDEDPERATALLELEDRILDRALVGERARTAAAEVRQRYGVPKEVLDRLAELEILSPNSRGYSPSDVTIIEAIGRFRAGGYDEQIGFTVYDTLRYKTALEELVRQEVDDGDEPPRRRGRARAGGGDARSRRRAAARPDRRPAHEAAGRRARAPARRPQRRLARRAAPIRSSRSSASDHLVPVPVGHPCRLVERLGDAPAPRPRHGHWARTWSAGGSCQCMLAAAGDVGRPARPAPAPPRSRPSPSSARARSVARQPSVSPPTPIASR